MRTLLKRGLTMTAGIVALLATTTLPAHAAAAPAATRTFSASSVDLESWPLTPGEGDRYGYTINANSTPAMAVLNASTANYAPMIQAPMTTALPNNDYMEFESQGGNRYRIKPVSGWDNSGNIYNDKCLVVLNASTADNAAVVQYSCTYYDGVNNDVWAAENVYSGTGAWLGDQLRNVKSGKCLTVQNASLAGNAKLIQYNCEKGAGYAFNELWWVSQVTS